MTIVAVGVCGACAQPPAQTSPRPAAVVPDAPARTFEAVLAEMVASGMPLKSVERGSYFVSTETVAAPADALTLADCGSAALHAWKAERVSYSAVVVPSDSGSALRASSAWTYQDPGNAAANEPSKIKDCISRGVWETEFEARVKRRLSSAARTQE